MPKQKYEVRSLPVKLRAHRFTDAINETYEHIKQARDAVIEFSKANPKVEVELEQFVQKFRPYTHWETQGKIRWLNGKCIDKNDSEPIDS